MALITAAELIVLLDLPHNSQPTDRADLVCTLVVDEVTRVAGGTLAEPYPAGLKGIALAAAARLYDNPVALRSLTTGGPQTTNAYNTDAPSILTEREEAKVRAATGTGGPQGSFPAWDWSWTAAPASTLSD